jgi:hypothetical protein
MVSGKSTRGASHSNARRPPLTSSWPSTRKSRPASGALKPNHLKSQTRQFDFPKSGHHLYSRELVWQAIQYSTTAQFRRSGSSSMGLSFGASLPNWVTNAQTMGIFIDDVPTLSTLGGEVRTVGSIADALPPEMVRTRGGFWLWRLLHRR